MANTPQPIAGMPVSIEMLGRVHTVWWGCDEDGWDCLANDGVRVTTFASVDSVRAHAERSVWATLEEESSILQLDPAMEWLHGRGVRVPPNSALNMWNLAQDVAYSLGLEYSSRERWKDSTYDKLVFLSVPWLAELGASPSLDRWHKMELRALREVLSDAVHILRRVSNEYACEFGRQ